jgi:putative transposase
MSSDVPTLVVMAGLLGAGKSTLALALARALGWPVVDKDLFDAVARTAGVTQVSPTALAYDLAFALLQDMLVEQRLSAILDCPAVMADPVERGAQLAQQDASEVRRCLVGTVGFWSRWGLDCCVKERPMPCPHCAATATVAQLRRTALGYHTFRCGRCRRTCNERRGSPYNHRQYPTDLVLLVVLWRLRYTLRLRDLAELFLARGFVFSHEAVRDWEARFAPLLTARLRAKRRGQGGTKWHADETYVKVNGTWCSLYRAIDREGNLVEALLREKRDMAAAPRFFAQALDIAGHAPEQVTTDGHDAYPRAIRETLGTEAAHRCRRYKNNRIEHDHRGIKQRSYPMRGFGSFVSAARCCSAFAEQRQYCRAQDRSGAPLSLAARRQRFQGRWAAVMAEMSAA